MRTFRIVWVATICGLVGCTGLVTGGEESPGGGDDVGDVDAGDDIPPPPGPDADPGDPPDGDPDAAPVDPTPDPFAKGIHIEEVAIFQAVSVPIAQNGSAVAQRNAPVIAGRDAVFAIGFEVDAGFAARSIEARIEIGGETYTKVQQVSASSGAAPATALRVEVPGSAMTQTATFAISLHEVAGSPATGPSADARYPADGTAELGAVDPNGPLHLVLVPFRYNADGSGRLPPVDAASVARYRDAFGGMYPVADVEVTVRAPVDIDFAIGSDASWSQWLDELDAVREADSPADNVYYYGVSSPASSFGNFCNGGCIVGLGHVPGANNSFLFASVGVSFTGNLLLDTSLHEVGHTMGRRHVGCGGPTGVDPNYPYDGGSIGVWGYDPIAKEFKDPGPNKFTDIMGYCSDQWISDYEFKAIFTRIDTVNRSAFTAVAAPQRYRVGIVDATGGVEWRRLTMLDTPPLGIEHRVSLRDASGSEIGVADGEYFAYDHIPGGTLYVPVEGLFEAAAIAPRGVTLAH